MSCNQALSGLVRDCASSLGGVKNVYIADIDWLASRTVTDGKISAITMNTHEEGGESVPYKFLKYYVRSGASSMTSTLNIDKATGVNCVSTELALTFARMDATKWLEMSALKVNDMLVIVEDMNGRFWYLGFDDVVTASAGTGQTGQARGDANNYSITLLDNANEFPYEVDADTAKGVIEA